MPVHSVPAAGEPVGCFTIARAAAPTLRDRVLGYGGFRSATGRGIRHRSWPAGSWPCPTCSGRAPSSSATA
ncbi:hypothetical protein ACQP2F_28745 [Actinoplanes sp. CA-030573]|uniref:hypothetical protein n=1 Tax=Actinoplanes sp. CA-030573 TaxID=3239898 RepID=UPI003D89D0CF